MCDYSLHLSRSAIPILFLILTFLSMMKSSCRQLYSLGTVSRSVILLNMNKYCGEKFQKIIDSMKSIKIKYSSIQVKKI